MHEIICPHCSKAFKIDEAVYADILKQVRDGAFEQQLHERLELTEQDKRNAVELAQAQVASEMQKSAVAKDSEIQSPKAKLDAGEVAIVIGGQKHFQGVILLPKSVEFSRRGLLTVSRGFDHGNRFCLS